jgi:hypothetical protein
VCLVHRGPTPARTEGTTVRSSELGLRPLWCAKAHLRGAKQRGERGELGSGLTGARAALWRSGDGGAEWGGGGARWGVVVDSEASN